MDEAYIKLLRKNYPTAESIYTELINLEAIQNLPKGTELYLSDLHGAHEEFQHILATGAGNVKEKLNNYFQNKLDISEINELNLLIIYTEYALKNIDKKISDDIWFKETITNLIDFMKYCAIKYTRSKLRKSLPEKYTYIMEELLYTDLNESGKESFYNNILNNLIELDQAEPFIIELCKVIKQLVIDHLHIVGDILDRSGGESIILEKLITHHSVDIQWGNHDILWMGAKFGSQVNLITLLRIAARYGYLFDLEKTYGLNLRPLFLYAEEHFDTHESFQPKCSDKSVVFQEESEELLNKAHQALAIMQFKLEGQIIERRPQFEVSDRFLINQLSPADKEVSIQGERYLLNKFPYTRLSPDNPSELFSQEKHIIQTLMDSFQQSEKLDRYIEFMLKKGSMYLVYNNHLLFHGCIPIDDNGDFEEMKLKGKSYSGKNLLDKFEDYIRKAAEEPKLTNDFATDILWYAWAGPKSPLFGRNKMTTFERYYINDKLTHQEKRNAYFELREEEEVIKKVLLEFNLSSNESKIINGHTPIKVSKGESPVKANKRLVVIDGGMNKAYREGADVAGYSLLNNSYGFQIVTHKPFTSIEELFLKGKDETTLKHMIDGKLERKLIKRTTTGERIQKQIDDLIMLIEHI